MEVYLRNVPVHLSENSLKKELDPFMAGLGILSFTCQKPRQRNVAWVTFLSESSGNTFLKKHQKVARKEKPATESQATNVSSGRPHHSRDIARLHILNTPIFVEKSNRKVDRFTISHLQHEKAQKSKGGSKQTPKSPRLQGTVSRMSCGKNLFEGPAQALQFIPQEQQDVIATAIFGQKLLVVKFYTQPNRASLGANDNRMEIPFHGIQDIIVGQATRTLTLVLNNPPKTFTSVHLLERDRVVQKWKRTSALPIWRSASLPLSQCLVYQMTFDDHGSDGTFTWSQLVRGLNNMDEMTITYYDFPFTASSVSPLHLDLNIPAFENKLARSAATRGPRGKLLPYSVLFQIQGLVWNNYLDPESGIAMLEAMEEMARESPVKASFLTTDAIKPLFQRIGYPYPGMRPEELDVRELLNVAIQTAAEMVANDPANRERVHGLRLADHQVWVLKALVTPTRTVIQGPEPESKNRVLRKYAAQADCFLRVTFADEDGEDLHFHPKVVNDHVYARWRDIMRSGITIVGRRFEFLGFSHSSLRSHSAWFSAPFIDDDMQKQDCNTILKKLGNFGNIRVPARCAARIGQAFSETPYTVPIFADSIGTKAIPDIKSADGSRVFSDGVGTISRDAMFDFWYALPMKAAAPTCFQIRWGGVKGMIALDSRLKGKQICIRNESMLKFQSDEMEKMEMGICDVASRPLRLVLNRQMIKILEDMGTRDEWFFAQQNRALSVLRNVTSQPSHTSSFLEHQSVGSNVGLSKLIRQLDRMGFDYRQDIFLKSVVEHAVLQELRLLKHKARIPVNQGVTLFGIMDETGILKEGEIYVTFEAKQTRGQFRMDSIRRDERVIVTRSPALHPGDVQVVRMVKPPAGHPLLELRNCVVFSQQGNRDLPSQLSGGDLDGDLYNIIWDLDALPIRTFEPADYARVNPKPLDRAVTRNDIADFFIDFMKTDILGVIANRHQILADARPGGTVDEDCIRLAEIHSTAVDYSKTGIAVDIGSLPKAPHTRPDFLAPAPPVKLYGIGQINHIGDPEEDDEDEDQDGMGRAKHKYHLSEKILGKLYRNVDEKKIWTQNVSRGDVTGGLPFWDQLWGAVETRVQEYAGAVEFQERLVDAWKIRDIYESAVSDSMWQYSDHPRKALTEVEVFCGSIMNKSGSQTRRQRDSSIKLKEDIERICSWIVDLILDRKPARDADTESNISDATGMGEAAMGLCLACFYVGCSGPAQSPPGAYHGTGELRSFKVVAAACLIKELDALAQRKNAHNVGGGYVGVLRRGGKRTVLPLR